jgi:two-component system cell cycle response regulator
MKILVADDDPTSRLIARTALQRLGHQCDTATDGTHAWNAFQTSHPDIVISDWMMPGQTGLQLCQSIRADPNGGYTYLILLTSRGAHHQILEGMNAGADDYLIKPLDPDELEARLIAATRVTTLHHQLAAHRTQLQSLNLELGTLARRDPLTGLNNRRVLQEDLALLEARVARYGHHYCMVLIDIDHFKSYNDTHGHQAGDYVLQAVTTRLQHQARVGDALYRYGGEEFLCILPEQTLATGSHAAQRMQAGVQLLSIPHRTNSTGAITISAGVATLDPDFPRSAEEVLKEADDALYHAKRLGGNRVENRPPTTVVTGERQRCLEAAANDHATKPVNTSELTTANEPRVRSAQRTV